ncbi:MAG: hypothetical protein ACHBN1_26505 [Heteroscytonema crispum UTEX LB 1556]
MVGGEAALASVVGKIPPRSLRALDRVSLVPGMVNPKGCWLLVVGC